MVARYGMSDHVGNLVFDNDSNEVFIGKDYGHTRTYSEETAAMIDREVKNIIDEAYVKVKELLTNNVDRLNHIARLLLEKEKIEGEEFETLMGEPVKIEGEEAGLLTNE